MNTTTAVTTTKQHWTGVDVDNPWLSLARQLGPELAATSAELDASGEFVGHGYQLLKERRMFSMLVPSERGGPGATHAEACAVLAELARACPATSLAFSMHTHLVAAQVWRHNRDLPAPVLDKLADQELVLVSTGASDWIDSNGSAVKVDGGYRVSGRKMPASGCPGGDIVITSSRVGGEVIHMAIPFSAEGVSVVETWDTMGMRATGSHTVVLDDVFVPEGAVSLTRPGGVWHPVWATVVGAAMPLIMSTYVGVAEEAAQRAVLLAGSKADKADTATSVGRMMNQLTAARDSARAMIDSSENLHFENTVEHAGTTLSRKGNTTDAVLATVRLAMEVAGGSAYQRASGIERLFRDAHGALYHPLPTARQEQFSGRAVLGLDPVVG